MASNTTGLAGEFYAMHRLFLEGYEATLTLGNTKGVDILLYNPKNEKQFKVEVKTSTTKSYEKLFDGEFYGWIMHKKHEDLSDENLVYCFVYIDKDTKESKIFLVPPNIVAKYVKEQHQKWLDKDREKEVKDTPMRKFRIRTDEDSIYEDNFKIFE